MYSLFFFVHLKDNGELWEEANDIEEGLKTLKLS